MMHRGILATRGAIFHARSLREPPRRVAKGLGVPNGMKLSADGRTLFVIDTLERTLLAYSVDGGALGEPVIVSDFLGLPGKPDGMTLAPDGTFWVAMWGGGCVVQLAATALSCAKSRCLHRTSAAHVSPDQNRLLVTSSRMRIESASAERVCQLRAACSKYCWIGTTMISETLRTVADVAMRWNYRVWGFGEAIALRGLLQAGDVLGDAAPFGFVHGILRSWLGRGVARSNEDHVGAGRELLELYRRTRDDAVSRRRAQARRTQRKLSQRPEWRAISPWRHARMALANLGRLHGCRRSLPRCTRARNG